MLEKPTSALLKKARDQVEKGLETLERAVTLLREGLRRGETAPLQWAARLLRRLEADKEFFHVQDYDGPFVTSCLNCKNSEIIVSANDIDLSEGKLHVDGAITFHPFYSTDPEGVHVYCPVCGMTKPYAHYRAAHWGKRAK